jgi:hypothetical protein
VRRYRTDDGVPRLRRCHTPGQLPLHSGRLAGSRPSLSAHAKHTFDTAKRLINMSARGYDEDMVDDMEEDAAPPRVRSTVATANRKQKGRGFREPMQVEEDDERHGRAYDSLSKTPGAGPQECKGPY